MNLDLILHISNAIALAEMNTSRLTMDAINVPAFTSLKVRHLLNNLGNRAGLRHLEIGVHKGGTFVATNFGNEMVSSVAVDNWSEFCQDGESKRVFLESVKLLKPGFQFLEMDCFAMTKEHLPEPINFYMYDGDHSYEAQKRALTHFHDMLADEFILVVDDYDWDNVQKGTRDGIAELGLHRNFEVTLPGSQGWWNGIYVAVLSKLG